MITTKMQVISSNNSLTF